MYGSCKPRVTCSRTYNITSLIDSEDIFNLLEEGDNIDLTYNILTGKTTISSTGGGGDPLTFDNGLTLTGDNVQLGGELINSETLLHLDSEDYKDFYIDLKNSVANSSTGIYSDNDGYIDLWGYNGNRISQLTLTAGTLSLFTAQTGGVTSLNFEDTNNRLRDDRLQVGLRYFANYASNNISNDRWLVDKGYVDGLLGNVVHKTGNESIAGFKTFTNAVIVDDGGAIDVSITTNQINIQGPSGTTSMTNGGITVDGSSAFLAATNASIGSYTNISANNIQFKTNSGSFEADLSANTLTADRLWFIPDANGTFGMIGTSAPASAVATGKVGEVRVTSTFIYTCIAPNTWVRGAMATW